MMEPPRSLKNQTRSESSAFLMFLVVVAGMASGSGASGGWSQLGSDAQRSGRSANTINNAAVATVVWTVSMPTDPTDAPSAGVLSPLVGPDGTVYWSTLRRACAVDGPTGAQRWCFAFPTARDSSGPPALLPATGTAQDTPTLLLLPLTQDVYAVSAATGAVVWHRSPNTQGGSTFSSPAVGPSLGPAGAPRTPVFKGLSGALCAFDGATGETLWVTATSAVMGVSTPALSLDAARVFAGTEHARVYAMNTTGGAILWTLALNNPVQRGAPAVGPTGTVYIACESGTLYALRGASDGVVLWTLDLADPDPSESQGTEATPAVSADDTVYFATENGTVVAIEGATGRVQWANHLNTGVHGRVQGAPLVDAAGKVVVATNTGVVAAFSSAGDLLWSLQLPTTYSSSNLGAGVLSALALGPNGVLYVGSPMGVSGPSRLFAISTGTHHSGSGGGGGGADHVLAIGLGVGLGGGLVVVGVVVLVVTGKARSPCRRKASAGSKVQYINNKPLPA